MKLVVVKVVVTPLLIAAATVTARRWGAGVGGWLAGFPLTSGPVSVFLALEQGPGFAGQAAVGTLLGLIGVAAFCVAYAWAARQLDWLGSTVFGLGTFLATTAVLTLPSVSLGLAFVGVLLALAAGTILIAVSRERRARARRPGWDIPMRMIAATAVVLLLTAAASWLGPRLSGILSTTPVFAGIMAAFTHRLDGRPAAAELLRGVVVGSFAFAGFFFVVGLMLGRAGLLPTYALAMLAALVVNGFTLGFVRRVL